MTQTNDIIIIGFIGMIFVFLGLFMPFVSAEFDPDGSWASIDVSLDEDDATSITDSFKILGSILSMFFWTFGLLPFWIDGIFLVFRVIFFGLIARNIWIGGGG